MSVDIIKFICSGVELVHEMQRLFHIRRILSYVLVATVVHLLVLLCELYSLPI